MARLITLLLLVLASTASSLSQTLNPPRLVLNVTVSGLRSDYLLKSKTAMNPGGIFKLINEGASCTLTRINYLNTNTSSGVASIATGTTPDNHGVIGNHWFDYTTNEKVILCFDKNTKTVGADELDAQLSPKNLVSSTIGDCIKDISPTSKVISVALSPFSAVVAGGFMADDCYWVSPRDGKMVTSSYYREQLPDWVKTFNDKKLASAYTTQKWIHSRKASEYHNVISSDIGGKDVAKNYNYSALTTAPGANSLLKDFVVQTIIAENLGKDAATDYLSVTFDALERATQKYGTASVECEDIFYRLDDEIATLLAFVESYIGKGQLLVVFNSAHGASEPVLKDSKLPSGNFNAAQFEILMNGFLGAQLTSKLSKEALSKIESEDPKWVLDFSENQIYLNRKKIFSAGLSLPEVQNMVVQFAIQFRGVASAITSTTLQSGQFSDGVMGKAQKNYFAKHSGDVTINLLPGWINSTDWLSDSGSPYIYDTHVPLIFWGGAIANTQIGEETSLEDIAPTVAKIVGVTPPNSSTGKPIVGIYK